MAAASLKQNTAAFVNSQAIGGAGGSGLAGIGLGGMETGGTIFGNIQAAIFYNGVGGSLSSDHLNLILNSEGGNVGIGTTNPAGPLHIHNPNGQGYVRISGTSDAGASYSTLYFDDNVTDDPFPVFKNSWVIGHRKNIGLPTENSFNIGYYNLSGSFISPVWINTSGNVGIGTTTPQTKAGQSGFLDAQDVWLRDAGAWASTGGGGGFGSWTNIDSSSNALVMNIVYRVTSDGFVIFRNNNSATVNQTIGYTDSSNSPTTERAVASEHSMDAIHSAMMPVKRNDYWRITTNFQPTYIYWLPIGSGQSVRCIGSACNW